MARCSWPRPGAVRATLQRLLSASPRSSRWAPISRHLTPVMVNGDRIRALRTREVVSDLRWRGMAVPPIYTSMAEEFQALVRSGAYAAWVASAEKARW